MDEYGIKQKIQMASVEPRAPEELIQQVTLRAQAVVMGVAAQKQLEAAPAEKVGELASRVMIGQLAAVTRLPEGARPEQLARQLEQEPAFAAALRGGNVPERLCSGELIRRLTGQNPEPTQNASEISIPQKEEPAL